MEWKKVEDKIFKFENEGDVIEGVLVGVEDNKTFSGKVYKLKNNDEIRVVFGTTVLDSQMSSVSIGDEVKIVFTGTKPDPKGRNDIKLYDVFTK